jgi:hypothetical protein
MSTGIMQWDLLLKPTTILSMIQRRLLIGGLLMNAKVEGLETLLNCSESCVVRQSFFKPQEFLTFKDLDFIIFKR